MQELLSCFVVASCHGYCTSQCSVLAQLAPTSKGLSISPYVQRLTLHWITLSTLLMMAHKAETAVQGWSVDPMEDVILTHTHTHARAHAHPHTNTHTCTHKNTTNAHANTQAQHKHTVLRVSLAVLDHSLSHYFQLYERARTHTHTQRLLASAGHIGAGSSCLFWLNLAAAYLKYRLCRLSCLPFVWHPFFIVTHTLGSGLVLAAITCLGRPHRSWEFVLILAEPRWTGGDCDS